MYLTVPGKVLNIWA